MALPFEERLNTNYAPSDEELVEISRILLEPQAHLVKMNDMIGRVQATLDVLKRHRDKLVQRIDQYRALTSPIRRIPQEILQEIFFNCLPTHRNAVMSAREAPLLLGRVCSNWRSISLSTPHLWTTVHVPMPTSTNYYPADITSTNYAVASKDIAKLRTAALQEWLKRSGSLPVDVSLSQWDQTPMSVDTNSQESQSVVDIILSVAQRWKKIAVAGPACSMTRFLTHPPHDLPLLESLDFAFSRIVSWGPISEIPQSKHNIYRTPSLRTLSLMQSQGDCLQLPVNWAYLTDLTILGRSRGLGPGLSLGQAMELLSRCPCLVRCGLEIHITEVTPVQFPSLRLRSLKCLSIFERVDVTHMFNCLDLPALDEIEYYTAVVPDPTRGSSLLTLLRKLDGSLQKFTTDPQLLMRVDFIECLRLIPAASSLTFKQPGVLTIMQNGINLDQTILDKEILHSFLPSARNVLCPKLNSLEIRSRLNFSDEDLLEFILIKQRGNSPKLKRVRIMFTRSRRMDIVPHLTGLVKEGLDLQLNYPTRPARAMFSPFEGLPNTIWL